MNKKEKMNLPAVISLALGFTVGSGIITQTGIAIAMTGRSVCLAFLVSAVLFLVAFRPLFIMATVLPHESAAYYYSKALIHEKVGSFYAYIYFLGRLSMAIFGISFAQYLGAIIPSATDPWKQQISGCLFLTFFFVINLLGNRITVFLQKIMCALLLGGILLYVGKGMALVDPMEYVANDFLLHGISGFYEASSLLFFAVGGAFIITDFAPSIENASKVMVKVIVGVTLLVCVLYMAMGAIAAGVLPVEVVAGKPLTLSASVAIPERPLFIFFIVAVCMGALMTTCNSSFIWYSNALTSPCQDGLFPKTLLDKNRNQVPWKMMTIFYLIGIVPVICGIDISIVSRIAIGLNILSTCIPMAGFLHLPDRFPEEWSRWASSDRYPKKRRIGMLVITYCIMLTQVYSLFQGNPLWANLILVICMICILIWTIKGGSN